AGHDRERLASVVEQWSMLHGGFAPRVLEIGCGDLRWLGDELPPRYTGLDLHRRETWETAEVAGARLIEGNACETELPRADIAVARLVFIHLSNRAILAILDRLRAAGVEWLMASTFPGADNPARLPEGEDYSLRGFPLDLEDAPFALFRALVAIPRGPMMVYDLGED
ncbi:MAG TPA: class I SAM-dependent methyltransferase, partial [Bacteroidia bacterium]|nr:class I SAM-dependent methyltransferase [Bacteroidia bacterium]